MKVRFIVSLIAVVFGIWTCKSGDTNNNPNAQNIILNDTSATTGKLTVQVYRDNFIFVGNVQVSLYVSYNDYINNIPLFTLITSSNGLVNFGFINYGDYYVRAGINSYQGLDWDNRPGNVVQVLARKETNAQVRINPI